MYVTSKSKCVLVHQETGKKESFVFFVNFFANPSLIARGSSGSYIHRGEYLVEAFML